ncbi:MAG TPA: PAS domain-containing protein, partial [Candidatus Acidoferrum sp.]|nr:PAS domain-containing protein [Candidatus Acidoferrum sp.]
MSLWGRKRDALGSAHELAQHAPRASAPHLCRQAAPRGVARATLEGASRLEILREALHELRAAGDAERLGIWMTEASEASEAFSPVESQPPGAIPAREAATKAHASAWRGVAWDAESQSAPREWQQLSAEAPIPQEALLGVRAVAQEFEAHNSSILISILVGMRRALWTPIASRSRVLGVILCASREKGQALPQGAAARLAADLALQLAWQEERAIARARYADLSLARRMHDELNAQCGPDAVLARLADSIVANATSLDAGLGAAFVTIGVLSHSPNVVAPVSTASSAIAGCQAATPGKASVEFLWKSGDPDWIRIAEGTALTETWQEALNTRRTTGMSPQRSWIPTAIARIVAVPILEDGELCGVLLAGLPRREASLAGLERLEYRAMLAGLAIARQQRQRSEAAAARRLRSQVAASREMLFVLDQDRKVADLSAAAGEILRGVAIAPHEQPNSFSAVIGTPFFHLFRPADRAGLDAWWCAAESCGEQWNPAPDELPAELA